MDLGLTDAAGCASPHPLGEHSIKTRLFGFFRDKTPKIQKTLLS